MTTESQNTSLSIIIITKDEETAIYECLNSVSWADEIIVVDANSSDKTVEISKNLGAKIHITKEWLGFGHQKNLALNLATKTWILSLDADEIVSSQLKQEIIQAIQSCL